MAVQGGHQHGQQRGAILFVSLIILLLITMVAIGSTRLSTMGQRTSLTYQLQNTAFQAADSALDSTQRLLENSSFALDRATAGTLPEQVYEYDDATTGLTTQATTNTTLQEKVSDSGNSLGVGKGLPQVYLYETTSTSEISGYQIVTELEQGYQIRTLDQ
ncbi:PilX N-terminal domain-containing pilus assembly protein [uncultured Endozoicomonas sp.]|uniref:pilus assembly PilX family protein n=1 Tax=uncultured Endozoicomonas sp. TaxID=432652 RepID=UPI0026148C59|nr:PilX N-terminal domain-containing pilus assembly protein [uncultured Endozoicomonas sp.]